MLLMAPLHNRGELRARLEAEGLPVESMLDQSGRLKRQIERIDGLLEIDLGGASLRRVQADFVALLRRRVTALRPVAERYGTALDFEEEVDRLTFAFDRDQIEHVLDALFQRIFEDVAPGDRVRLAVGRCTTPEGERAVVEVFDTGRRIAENYRRLLCEGQHWAQESVADGIGLGLALAYRYVYLHGGEIRVEGEGRFGTRVRVLLPLHQQTDRAPGHVLPAVDGLPAVRMPEEAAAASAAPSGGPAGGPADEPAGEQPRKTTVLVVDDHPATRGYLSFALSKEHRVLEASNGEEALALVREHLPDLVISDVMMPVMNGQELCRAIKSDADLNHIPVFLVTANVVPDVKREGLESGADDYLTKPFDLEEALLRINNMIAMRGQLRRRYSREVVIKPSDITVSSADEAFLERARQLVEEHMEDGAFGVQELASEMGLSPRQLQRRLRDTVGQSPVEFIRSLRLQRAAQLLEQQYGNVSEVAYSVGFTSLSYFAKCFREQYGRSPSEFKSEQAT